MFSGVLPCVLCMRCHFTTPVANVLRSIDCMAMVAHAAGFSLCLLISRLVGSGRGLVEGIVYLQNIGKYP